jgi:hypothetical protein
MSRDFRDENLPHGPGDPQTEHSGVKNHLPYHAEYCHVLPHGSSQGKLPAPDPGKLPRQM